MKILKLDAIGEICPTLTTSIRSFITRNINELSDSNCVIVIETDAVNPEEKIKHFIEYHQLVFLKQVKGNITLLLIKKEK